MTRIIRYLSIFVLMVSTTFAQSDKFYTISINTNFIPTGFSMTEGQLHFFSPIQEITIGIPDTSFVKCSVISESKDDTITIFELQLPGSICNVIWLGKDEGGHKVKSGLYNFLVEAQLIRHNLSYYFKGETRLLIP